MEPDPALTPRIQKIAEGIHVRLAVDNIAWIDPGDGLLVVDALEEAALEEEVFAAIAATSGPPAGGSSGGKGGEKEKPVRFVLNTHTHYDHVALNAAFQRRWGAEIVAQPDAGLGPDGRWFQGPLRKVLMQPLPGCHTDEDCIVWAPAERILFAGDIFGWGLIPSTRLNDEVARRLVAGYNQLIAMDPAVVVPGHGPLCGCEELAQWIEYFRRLIGLVLAAVSAGRSDAEIRAAFPPPQDMKQWWRFVKWKHEDSVTRTLAAVRHKRLTAIP